VRESINGHAVFNNNQMTRQLDLRPVVLVESDSDLSIIGSHLQDDGVRCAPGFSKSAILLAAELHRENDDNWVVAVVDHDLAGADGSNVVATSHYDLEAEIYFKIPEKTKRYVYSFVVSEKIPHESAKAAARDSVLAARNLASTIGVMRKFAHENRLRISMSALPIAEIVDRDNDGDYVESVALVASMKAQSPQSKDALEDAARAGLAGAEKSDLLCCGHDLLQALCVFIGRQTGRPPRARDFARGFHACVECNDFRELSIHDPLRAWLSNLTGQEIWDCVA